jgi:hypothetical protein
VCTKGCGHSLHMLQLHNQRRVRTSTTSLSIPVLLQGEVKTKAHRKGDGLEVGVSQLNAVLRF